MSLVLTAAMLAGCGGPRQPEFTETKRVDERLSSADLSALLFALESLTPEERRALPLPLAERPHWSAERTLPVRELLEEELVEQKRLREPATTARAFPKSQAFSRSLRRLRLTREQLAALYNAAAGALCRWAWEGDRSLNRLIEQGEQETRPLRDDERPFASLPPETQYQILEKTAWVAVIDRASLLQSIPEENVALVESREEDFRALLPEAFFKNPLSPVLPRLEIYGLPFSDPKQPNADVDLTWSRDDLLPSHLGHFDRRVSTPLDPQGMRAGSCRSEEL